MACDLSTIPIIVLALNRPDCLAEVLAALMRQDGAAIERQPVFLFQDGGRNPRSGEVYASEAVVRHNLHLFRRLVPHGVAIPARANLGVALNYDRAERFAFQELGAAAAIFLEDDFVPGRCYLQTVDRLIELALAEAGVGYVAAYGDPAAPRRLQHAHPARLIAMRQSWGFGLTRRQWLRQKPLVDQYLAIVGRRDYQLRDTDRIVALFHEWGLGAPGTSQDVAKAHACLLTGAARVNTFASFARSIGSHGLQFEATRFEGLGFGAPEVMEQDVFRLVPPDAAELDRLRDEGRRAALRNLVAPGVRRSRPASPQAALEQIGALSEAGTLDAARALCMEWLARAPGFRDDAQHPAFLKQLVQLTLGGGRERLARELAARLQAQMPPGDPWVGQVFAGA